MFPFHSNSNNNLSLLGSDNFSFERPLSPRVLNLNKKNKDKKDVYGSKFIEGNDSSQERLLDALLDENDRNGSEIHNLKRNYFNLQKSYDKISEDFQRNEEVIETKNDLLKKGKEENKEKDRKISKLKSDLKESNLRLESLQETLDEVKLRFIGIFSKIKENNLNFIANFPTDLEKKDIFEVIFNLEDKIVSFFQLVSDFKNIRTFLSTNVNLNSNFESEENNESTLETMSDIDFDNGFISRNFSSHLNQNKVICTSSSVEKLRGKNLESVSANLQNINFRLKEIEERQRNDDGVNKVSLLVESDNFQLKMENETLKELIEQRNKDFSDNLITTLDEIFMGCFAGIVQDLKKFVSFFNSKPLKNQIYKTITEMQKRFLSESENDNNLSVDSFVILASNRIHSIFSSLLSDIFSFFRNFLSNIEEDSRKKKLEIIKYEQKVKNLVSFIKRKKRVRKIIFKFKDKSRKYQRRISKKKK